MVRCYLNIDLLTQPLLRLAPVQHYLLTGTQTLLPFLESARMPLRDDGIRVGARQIGPNRLHRCNLLRSAHGSQWQVHFHWKPFDRSQGLSQCIRGRGDLARSAKSANVVSTAKLQPNPCQSARLRSLAGKASRFGELLPRAGEPRSAGGAPCPRALPAARSIPSSHPPFLPFGVVRVFRGCPPKGQEPPTEAAAREPLPNGASAAFDFPHAVGPQAIVQNPNRPQDGRPTHCQW